MSETNRSESESIENKPESGVESPLLFILEELRYNSSLQKKAFGKTFNSEKFKERFGEGASTNEFKKIGEAMGIGTEDFSKMVNQMVEKIKNKEV